MTEDDDDRGGDDRGGDDRGGDDRGGDDRGGYNRDNVFAKILRGEIPCDKVGENGGALAFRDVSPQAPVHVLVIPKALVKTLDEWLLLGREERDLFLDLVGEVIEGEGLKEGGYRVVANAGRDGGQEVPHFHVHILGVGDGVGGMRGSLGQLLP